MLGTIVPERQSSANTEAAPLRWLRWLTQYAGPEQGLALSRVRRPHQKGVAVLRFTSRSRFVASSAGGQQLV